MANPTGYSDFQNRGYPGKYVSMETVADGQTDYTGSKYGASGVIVVTHGSAVIHLAKGGSITAANLNVKTVHDLSISKITAASSAVIYVLKKHG